MIQIELTSKLVLAIIGITSVGAILVPTYAVPTIKSADIFDETIVSTDLKDGGAVKSSDIVNGEVKAEDLASGAVKPNVQRVQGDITTLAPGSQYQSTAQCPAGTIVTGGGYDAFPDVSVYRNSPQDGDSWLVVADNQGSIDVSLTAYALCIGPSP